MPELNVSASVYFVNSATPIAVLTVMVSDASGAARKDLALADFTVTALAGTGADTEPVKVGAFNSSAFGAGYQLSVSRSVGSGFDITVPWTFIVRVYYRTYSFFFVHTDYEGWAVAGVDYNSTPFFP
jgi:hypothetical protein